MKEQIFYNDEIIKKVEGYEAEGCGIAVDDIFRYVQALIQKKRFQEADSFINSFLLEGNPNYTSQVARLLLYSFRINEAVQLIGSKKELNAYDYEILGKCFLKLGFVASAKRMFNKALEAELNFKVIDVVKQKLLEIYNYEHCGAFLEISYPAFVQSGQNLQVGHVVNLREDPEVIAGDASYDKTLNLKNFLVWKIDDDDIYLIPLTSRIRGTGYVIYKKDYPNIGKDRCVRDYICKSKKNNIMSIIDMLRNKDINNAKYNVFLSYYFNKTQTPEMLNYMHEISYEVDQYNMIDFIDTTKKRKSYFISEITDDSYIAYEADFFKKEILNYEPIEISKNIPYFTLHVLSRGDIFDMLEQIKNPIIREYKKSSN